MQTESSTSVRCSVSQEFVDLIANAFPDKFISAFGQYNTEEVLHFLGFSTYSLGSYTHLKGQLIRDNNNTTRVYRTDIFCGGLRQSMTKRGEASNRLYNYLFNLYDSVGVLQPNDIKSKEFFDILDIGADWHSVKCKKH